MTGKILTLAFVCLGLFVNAKTIVVKNAGELKKANKEAAAGDIIILQNGEWNNVNISLDCNGTKEKPIIFKAETAGKVLITGNSKLQLGGNFIIVDGLYFTRGFSGSDPVINYRINKNQLANNCRVTNTVINDFNNLKRMDENYWVSFSGKNNRIDHCSFLNKKNMGVLLAVILDDERSRENFHAIDHNYFGVRLPLASNSGEMIRVGVSQHCEFNSNTQITDNFFEHCDGETEIISIKSGTNVVRNNLFRECQGSVVLRHGNYNTVENNIFLGNNKPGTGGVRVINKGQWVVNNLFYQCRGEWFRSPLSIMNGVPNSPAFRYVAVTDAVIANNSFVDCTPIGLGIGSDTERSVAPKDVQFLNNVFLNRNDPSIYNAYDNISGISFYGNLASKTVLQQMVPGFSRTKLTVNKVADISMPVTTGISRNNAFDSLIKEGKTRLINNLSEKPGFADEKLFLSITSNAKRDCGAAWFSDKKEQRQAVTVNCATAESIGAALAKHDNIKLTVNLTGTSYHFKEALFIAQHVVFTGKQKDPVKFIYSKPSFLIQLKAGNTLGFKNINLDLAGVTDFISTDTSGSCNHSNFSFIGAQFSNVQGVFFNATESSVADSIIVNNSGFINCKGKIFNFTKETTKKGYYNVERLKMTNNRFIHCSAPILDMLRGGNDESTLGPDLLFASNKIENCNTGNDEALIHLFGTQLSTMENNVFTKSNAGKTIIHYEDLVRAVHILRNNKINSSGKIIENKFVETINTSSK